MHKRGRTHWKKIQAQQLVGNDTRPVAFTVGDRDINFFTLEIDRVVGMKQAQIDFRRLQPEVLESG